MRALASYILRGPLQAVVALGASALLTLVIPVAGYVSGGVVALLSLEVGARRTLLVMAGAAVVLVLVVGALLPVPWSSALVVALGFGLGFWVPVWLIGALLRVTRSLALAFQGAAGLGLIAVLAAFLLLQDPAQAWVSLLEQLRPQLEKAGFFAQPGQYEQLEAFAPVVVGTMAALAAFGVIVSLLIGRGLQAQVRNPGALRTEFSRVRFDRLTGLVTLVLALLALTLKPPLAVNVVIVLTLMYMFGGLAVIHGVMERSGAGRGWLVGLYGLIAVALFVPATGLLPHLLLVLAVLGLIDTWANFRARVGSRAG